MNVRLYVELEQSLVLFLPVEDCFSVSLKENLDKEGKKKCECFFFVIFFFNDEDTLLSSNVTIRPLAVAALTEKRFEPSPGTYKTSVSVLNVVI